MHQLRIDQSSASGNGGPWKWHDPPWTDRPLSGEPTAEKTDGSQPDRHLPNGERSQIRTAHSSGSPSTRLRTELAVVPHVVGLCGIALGSLLFNSFLLHFRIKLDETVRSEYHRN